jgi:hypothetical protein
VKTRFAPSADEPVTAEAELVLCCARTEIAPQTRERISGLLRSELDWARVRQYAAGNFVVPLLCYNLLQHAPEHVPPNVLQGLRVEAEKFARWNQIRVKQLLVLIDLLAAAGIPAVPFKGVVVAIAYYGNLAWRQCGDHDLLVRRSDFLRAKSLLMREGYQQRYFGHHEVSTGQAELSHPGGETTVDLHYSMTPHYQHVNMNEARTGVDFAPSDRNCVVSESTYWFFNLDADPMWERLETLTAGGRSVQVLSTEDSLLTLAVHAMKENWRLLRRTCDIAELLRARPGLDWDRVMREVRSLRCERKFLLALRLAHDLLDAPLPPEILARAARAPVLGALSEKFRRRLFNPVPPPEREPFRYLVAFLTMDGLRDRLRYFRYVAGRLWQHDRRVASVAMLAAFLREAMRHLRVSGKRRTNDSA